MDNHPCGTLRGRHIRSKRYLARAPTVYCGSDEPEWLWCTDGHLRDGCACIACGFAREVGAICFEGAVVGTAVWWWAPKNHMSAACGREEGNSRERENGHD